MRLTNILRERFFFSLGYTWRKGNEKLTRLTQGTLIKSRHSPCNKWLHTCWQKYIASLDAWPGYIAFIILVHQKKNMDDAYLSYLRHNVGQYFSFPSRNYSVTLVTFLSLVSRNSDILFACEFLDKKYITITTTTSSSVSKSRVNP